MANITKELLRNTLDNVNKMLGTTKDNELVFYCAYGKIQLNQMVEGTTGERTISCPVTTREMYYILNAMENLLYRTKEIKLK